MNRQNAVWKIQKNLNAVLNELRREYSHLFVFSPTDQLSSSEKTSMVEEKKVYLEFDKIEELIEHIPSNEKLANIKLILLTLVFTGCRYSDVFKVVPEYTYTDNTLEYRYAHFITDKQPKTEVIVPILKPLEDAIAANDGNLPKAISSQKFNVYVKELGQEIGWTEEVKIVYTDAHGDKQFETKPFYMFISSGLIRSQNLCNGDTTG
jgi:integrase